MRLAEIVFMRFARLVPCDVSRIYRVDVGSVRYAPVFDDGIRCRFLEAAELDGFLADPANELNPGTLHQVEAGRVGCFAAIDEDGSLAGYACFGESTVDPGNNRGSGQLYGIGLRLPEGARFLFQAFVRPEFRGRGLMGRLIGQAAEEYASAGEVHELVTTTSWTNRAFQVTAQRCGFELIGHTAEIALFGRHFYRYPTAESDRYGFFGGVAPQ
jgi:GNAT superfamily N-acetyltransferase